MPRKEGKTKKQNVRRNFIDFIVDASNERSTVADNFLKVLKKEDVTAEDLYQCLKKLGYTVGRPSITKIFETYKNMGRLKDAVTDQGY